VDLFGKDQERLSSENSARHTFAYPFFFSKNKNNHFLCHIHETWWIEHTTIGGRRTGGTMEGLAKH